MNKNLEILNKPIFNLPVKREKGDFIKYLENKFNEFHSTLSEFDGELGDYIKENSEIISSQLNCIFSALHSYYEGKTATAYNQLVNCLENVCCHLWIQTEQVTEGRDKLYRVRTGDSTELERKDLFHIPFELRNLVRRQRFSLSGVPCLYLGTSIYTCWEELNRPDINKIHISRFDLNESDFNFLFLDQRSDIIRKWAEKPFEECEDGVKRHIKNFIVSFPLLLASSIKVENYESDFVPEYIIPQLLLQWVTNSEHIDGIQYISNKTKYSIKPVTFESETNIVIPIKEFKDKGYCPVLSSKIKLTQPISYNLLDLTNSEIKSKQKKSIWNSKKDKKTIELIKGNRTDYSETKFGILESKLQEMETKYVIEK
ncbi:hypothetical protein [Corallibacter sp.]|uniref:hypothetical protein n=1 Tax=Corallibacter sp. TaxID=2038084 RepID=UPI003AB8EC89